MRSLRMLVILSVLTGVPAFAQDALQAQYDTAYDAWDAGRYPEAVESFRKILQSDGGDRFLESVALVTGEWYAVDEIAPDGRALAWSPDGRYAAYETGSVDDGTQVTHVIIWENGRRQSVADISSVGSLTFSPTGDRIAYLTIPETPELKAARNTLNTMMQARDFRTAGQQRAMIQRLKWQTARLFEENLLTKEKGEILTPGLSKMSVAYRADGNALFLTTGPSAGEGHNDIYLIEGLEAPRKLTRDSGRRGAPSVVSGGRYLVYTSGESQFTVLDLTTGRTNVFDGTAYDVSANGAALVFLSKEDNENTVVIVSLNREPTPRVVQRTPFELSDPGLSPDGSRVIYQMRPREDWELYVVNADGSNPFRLTYDIQHDLFPRFLTNDQVLGIIGEGRHRRSFLYDLNTLERTRLFHNNTIRTVAPEYEWAVSPDASRIMIVSERDGDTISPERGVYLVDLKRKVTKQEVQRRLDGMLAAELDLRERGGKMYAVIDAEVRRAVVEASITRIYGYGDALHRFESKHITMPGNHKAIAYLTETLKSFGYESEEQWFEPRPGIRSANVIATLPGTVNPELVYVISSHFDSSQRGPGSDDNTSGTTALLEAARIMAGRPMPATIKFAFFTGEEAGLLGSREYVRRAAAENVRLVGALNNDMVGWANDHRLDDTIRYSNAGIRDVQHAAAFLYTDLITYDAKYYKSTDAHAYYDQYGDIVGGIGSYPILSSPHYHQSHDVLEIINHRLVTEVCKTTVGSIMLLASSPARLTNLAIAGRQDSKTEVTWTPAPEKGVSSYIVAYGREGRDMTSVTVREPRASLPDVGAGMTIQVKAVNERGMASWDWARVIVD